MKSLDEVAKEILIEKRMSLSQLERLEGDTFELARDVEMDDVPTLKKGTEVTLDFVVTSDQLEISLMHQGKRIRTYVRQSDIKF